MSPAPSKEPLADKATLEEAAIQGWIALGVRTELGQLLGLASPPSWRELTDAVKALVHQAKRRHEEV